MSTIKLAIAGIGNCASSLLQGLTYYKDADPSEEGPGLMHVELGGYHIRDIELVTAFDVDATKVGLDAGKAIFAGQNNTVRFAPVGELGVTVQRGPTLDGFGKYYREVRGRTRSSRCVAPSCAVRAESSGPTFRRSEPAQNASPPPAATPAFCLRQRHPVSSPATPCGRALTLRACPSWRP